jgi:NIMA (never in mitosis gene a)-related kinase|tara:strand:- start:1600 stop:1722 length:123 start_codon:yes stop_codon:yes gene_type:complete
MENYEKLKKIGRGTYGDVLLVRRKKDNELLAMKKVILETI